MAIRTVAVTEGKGMDCWQKGNPGNCHMSGGVTGLAVHIRAVHALAGEDGVGDYRGIELRAGVAVAGVAILLVNCIDLGGGIRQMAGETAGRHLPVVMGGGADVSRRTVAVLASAAHNLDHQRLGGRIGQGRRRGMAILTVIVVYA